MKKKILFVAVLFVAMLLQAKNRTIVVRGYSGGTIKTATEVTTESSDSIVITPGDGVTTIQVTVTDMEGEVISQNILPADESTTVDIDVPDESDACLIEVEDNTGIVYTGVE